MAHIRMGWHTKLKHGDLQAPKQCTQSTLSFYLSHDVTSRMELLLLPMHEMDMLTSIHLLKRTSLQRFCRQTVLYSTCKYLGNICGGLGVDISQLRPRRAHSCGRTTTSYGFLDGASDGKSSGRSVRIPKRSIAAPHFRGGRDIGGLLSSIHIFNGYTIINENFRSTW